MLLAMPMLAAFVAEVAMGVQRDVAERGCQRVKFGGEVRDQSSFRRQLGPELFFYVDHQDTQGGDGWEYEIGSRAADEVHQYIYVVTPPYRGFRWTMLYPSYLMSAQEIAAPGESDFWFVLTRQDMDKASYAVGQLIFSGATQPGERSFAQLEALPKGKGVFRIVSSEFTPGTYKSSEPVPPELQQKPYPNEETLVRLYGEITAIAFEVELVFPGDFAVADGLPTVSAPCPGSWRTAQGFR